MSALQISLLAASTSPRERRAMRRELESAFLLAKNLSLDSLPDFLGELETIRVTAFARIASPTIASADYNLDVTEAAERLHVSKSYLYRNHQKFPFTRPEGTRVLFSSAGIDAYLAKKTR
jgi:excisionase family DNA binding protein